MTPARHETLLTIEYKVVALYPIVTPWQEKMRARPRFAQGQGGDVSPLRNGAQIPILVVLRCFRRKHLRGDAVHAEAHGSRTTCATKLFRHFGQREKAFAEAAQMTRDMKSQQARVGQSAQTVNRPFGSLIHPLGIRGQCRGGYLCSSIPETRYLVHASIGFLRGIAAVPKSGAHKLVKPPISIEILFCRRAVRNDSASLDDYEDKK